jgi:hypothetical protein
MNCLSLSFITYSVPNEIGESNTIKRLTTVISHFHFVDIAQKEE